MGYQSLLVDRADGIATITMNRPEARNALDYGCARSCWTRSTRSSATPRCAWSS